MHVNDIIYIQSHTHDAYHAASANVSTAVWRLLDRVPINNTHTLSLTAGYACHVSVFCITVMGTFIGMSEYKVMEQCL